MNKGLLHNSSTVIVCKNCAKDLGLRAEAAATAYKLSYICSCGELVCAQKDVNKLPVGVGSVAHYNDDGLVCPACREVLFSGDKKQIGRLAFGVLCSCGQYYSAKKEMDKNKRKIGEYASEFFENR